MLRRELLTGAGLALAAGTISSARGWSEASDAISAGGWSAVRAQFALSDELIHMSAMLISSHPKLARDAIEKHRRAMDANPVTYLSQRNHLLQEEARAAAGQYLGVHASDIALTDSTTMGVGLVYNGCASRLIRNS